MKTLTLALTPENNAQLNALCGHSDEILHLLERHLAVEISHRGHQFSVFGPDDSVEQTIALLPKLYRTAAKQLITRQEVMLLLQTVRNHSSQELAELDNSVVLKTPRATIKPRGANQQRYIRRVQKSDISFGIGPAGTGKTFLAVACAVAALQAEEVQRLILVRPAVEAGESLGFLPGDLAQKVDPYLRPIYDALYELMGFETVQKLIERHVIEIAPLAFMRGRSLNDAFVILDEAQNTTCEQMKMFLTRLGFNSTAVITGDITQVDLPKGKLSGLRDAISVLSSIPEISFTFFDSHDVVRHPLVQKIVTVYEQRETDAKANPSSSH